MAITITLTENQQSLLVVTLQMAMPQFRLDSVVARNSGNPEIAEQFVRQVGLCAALVRLIEGDDSPPPQHEAVIDKEADACACVHCQLTADDPVDGDGPCDHGLEHDWREARSGPEQGYNVCRRCEIAERDVAVVMS